MKSQVKGHCQGEVHPKASCSHLIVRSDIEGHKPLQKNFRGLVVAKQGISVNIVAGSGVKQSKQIRGSPKHTAFKSPLDMRPSLSLGRGAPDPEQKHMREDGEGK